MKVQNLAIIFLVITIPLILILSYYLNLQQETLELQAEYDTKLAEATKEGVRAFEINTVDWADWVSYKTTTTQRKEVKAAVNTFISSLANNLNISGTAKEYMVNYIPAVAATMYDGYYVYAPNYIPKTIEDSKGVQLFYDESTGQLVTDSNSGKNLPAYEPKPGAASINASYVYTNNVGNNVTERIRIVTDIEKAKMEYKYILSNHIAYAEKYIKGNLNVVINYTLDNRIYINGTKGTDNIEKDGYLVYFNNEAVLPRITINTSTPNDKRTERDITIKESAANTVYSKKITNAITNKTKIESEILTEQIVYKDEIGNNNRLGTFKYIYDIQNEKLYYDEVKENFFSLQKDKTRNYLLNTTAVKLGDSECRYKSISVLLGTGETAEYKKIYQVLNGKDKGEWYIDLKEDTEEKEEVDTEITGINLILLGLADTGGFAAIYKDFSAINYYVEAYAFTNWVKQNLGGQVTVQELEYDSVNNKYKNTPVTLNGIFNISATNDPEDEYSFITQHKRELIKAHITTNLNLAISNYSLGTYEFKLPYLTDSDWDQVFSNISLITFFQGVPIGLKYYNNYAIATSTTNREYVDPGEIYFSGEDSNYHRVYCEKCGNIVYTGYRSVEYVLKEYSTTTGLKYYYQHDDVTPTNRNSETACYYCVVNKANYQPITDGMANSEEITYKQAKSYNEALARERYYQKEDIIGKVGVTITYHKNLAISGEVTGINNMPDPQEAEIGAQTQLSTKKPTVTTNDPFVKYVFVGWAESSDSSTIKYMPGDTGTFYEDTDLYAIWRISLSKLPWSMDYYWTSNTTGFDGGWSCDSRGKWNGGPWASGVYDGSISYISVSESTNGSKIQMVGNSEYSGKGAIWATFESEYLDIAQFQFDYEINKGDSLNAGGFMFNIKETATTLEGYMLSINFAGSFKSKAGTNGAIYKFKYNKGNIIGQPSNNKVNVESIELVATLAIGTYDASRGSGGSGTITITVTDTGYVVKCSELASDVTIPVSDIRPNTFGFFSDHYSHACDQIGYFKLDNIKVTVVRDR